MPYVPPSLEQLHISTTDLLKEFHKRKQHYNPPNYEELVKKITVMRGIYLQRVAEKPEPLLKSLPVVGPYMPGHQPSSQHLEEIDCINTLLRSLPETEPGSEDRLQAHSILLGALIYRFIAIAAPYKETYLGMFTSACRWTVENTAMYATLQEILTISDENKLDDYNIAIACAAYLKFLRDKGAAAKKDAGYVPEGEKEFFTKLPNIVLKNEKASKPIADQIKFFVTIQSFNRSLSKMASALSEQFKLFSNKRVFFQEKSVLTQKEIMGVIKKDASKFTPLGKTMIEYFIKDDECLEQDKSVGFIDAMNGRCAIYCQYTLIGIYIMTLKKAEEPLVSDILNRAIGNVQGQTIDDDNKGKALSALEHYLQLQTEQCDLDFNVWDSRQLLLQDVQGALDNELEVQETLDATGVFTF